MTTDTIENNGADDNSNDSDGSNNNNNNNNNNENNWKDDDFLCFGDDDDDDDDEDARDEKTGADRNGSSGAGGHQKASMHSVPNDRISDVSDLPPWMNGPMNRFDRYRVLPMVRLHNEVVGFVKLIEPRQNEIAQREDILSKFKELAMGTFPKVSKHRGSDKDRQIAEESVLARGSLAVLLTTFVVDSR